MNKIITFFLFCILPSFLTSVYCFSENSLNCYKDIKMKIESRFNNFIKGMDEKDINLVMQIYGDDVIGEFKKFPPRNFQKIKEGVLSTFDGDLSISHQYEIKEIIPSDDLVVVRVDWIVTSTNLETGEISSVRERGVDIFKKYGNQWKIYRYLAY